MQQHVSEQAGAIKLLHLNTQPIQYTNKAPDVHWDYYYYISSTVASHAAEHGEGDGEE